jgi:RNA:NAD 2'-phosphotransferase (TPT1/KptA family)
LRVDAAAAHRDGFSFYHPVDEIYLTADLPARYLEVEEEG